MSARTDPHARLLARTRLRLAVVILALVSALVIAIGAVTAFTAIRALDDDVDRALTAATDAFLARGDASAVAAGAPASGAQASGADGESSESGDEPSERPPASSDTFFLVLDTSGTVVSNPSLVPLDGLPDAAAVASASGSGRDLRTVDAGGISVRLLTVPIVNDGAPSGHVQAGYVLTLHDRQSQTLVWTVVIVCGLGLLGAALVTVVVVNRALVPIRAAFDTERRFVADASHEIRTPAAIIRASAEVLEREGLVTEAGRPLVADVVSEADRLGRLVDDLLALDASDRGALSLDRRPVDLRAIARDTTTRAGPLAAERDVTFVGPGDGPPVNADADPDRLIQSLVVLLDNAMRHSPAGGTVTVAVERAGGHAVLSVADEGPGIPRDARERVFEPFARLPGAAGAKGSGSGLGLAIARRIVELHGGTLTADDAPGGGARFVIALPPARGGAVAAPAVGGADRR
ncbi:MAG: HAMP domain-containing sensor histidine kinase [Chloroflexota bacterium]